MKLSAVVLGLMVAVGAAWAQRFHIGDINAQTPEGQLLQQIGQESDEAKKLALLEQFASKFGNDKAAGWVYEQMQAAYLKSNQPDKTMEMGEKLIALDAEDTVAAQQSLKAAEAKKDPDLIRKWAERTNQVASKEASSPQPKEAAEVENWKARVDYATQVKKYTDYALYATALQTPDPKKKIELVEALEKQNPQSEYLPQAMPTLFLAYRQAGDNDKALALAEKVLAGDQSNEDMLLLVADSYMQKKKDADKVHAYTAKVVELMGAKPKPDGVSDADWTKRKNMVTGVAEYMNGKLYYTENKFAPADKELRAALPLVGDNAQMKAEVLFYLGVANYKLEKIQDAATFNRECAAMKSPYVTMCTKNLAAIRTQYKGVK